MDDSEDNLSAEDIKTSDSPLTVKNKPKKRSLIERELETNLTARVTSPAAIVEGINKSRYGRARRLKTEIDNSDTKKLTTELKSPLSEKSPLRNQSPVYKMHASNSPIRTESAKKDGVDTFLDSQIESIYQENIALSRFSSEENKSVTPSPAKKFPKVYIRKDLIQNKEPEETMPLIKNMFSPIKSEYKTTNTHLNNILERSSERYNLSSSKQQNGYLDNSSVVKTLDFDMKKKKKENKDGKVLSKSDLFDLEAKCQYQVGDLAWARMGTYPFWPCIITRDPATGVFVKKKLFGRIERDIIHVTFFGDNGRRGWIVDTMLRRYLGQLEFESTRDKFTAEDKKKDPRLYAAFFVSEKKLALWSNSVEEAEMLLREPKRLRIDIFNDMLEKFRARPKQPKSGKISRTDSDVSLSESLYDSLFSEDDNKADGNDRSRNKPRNKSFDVFEVVTACLDNMAAKSGITKIQRQSHMDRWLQKAKSKTPEKLQAKSQIPIQKLEVQKERKVNNSKSKKKSMSQVPIEKPYSLRRSMNESQSLLPHQNEHDYSKTVNSVEENISSDSDNIFLEDENVYFAFPEPNGLGIVAKVESLRDKVQTEHEDPTIKNESCSDDIKETSDQLLNGSCDSQLESIEECNKSNTSFGSSIEIKSTPKIAKKNVQPQSKRYSGKLRSRTNRNCKKQIEDNSFEIKEDENPLNNSRFLKYLELRQDSLMDENPELSHEEIVAYLYKTWLYEASPRTIAVPSEKENNEIIESCVIKSNFRDPNEINPIVRESKVPEYSVTGPVVTISNGTKHAMNESNVTQPILSESDTAETFSTETDTIESSYKEKKTEDSITDNDESIVDTGINIEPISIDPNETCDEDSQDSLTSANRNNSSAEDGSDYRITGIDKINIIKQVNIPALHEQVSADLHNMVENNVKNTKISKADEIPLDDTYCSSDSESLPYSDLTDHGDKLNLNEDFLNEDTSKVNDCSVTRTERESIVESPTFTQIESPTFTQMDSDTLTRKEIVESPTSTQRDSPTFTQMDSDTLTRKEMVESPTFTQRESATFTQTESEIITKGEEIAIPTFGQKDIAESPTFTHRKDIDSPDFIQKDSFASPTTTQREAETNKYKFKKDHAVESAVEIPKISSHLEELPEDFMDVDTNVTKNIVENDNRSNDVNSHTSESNDNPEVNMREVNVIENKKDTTKSTDPANYIIDKKTYPQIETIMDKEIKMSNVKEIEVSPSKEVHIPNFITETVKENGFHHDNNMNGDIDSVSINSEDSVTSIKSESKRKLRSKQDKKKEVPLDNCEFLKFIEMRQDALMDENPGLNHEEIVAYLYKTWLYEESAKSDEKKNDDLKESNLVKGTCKSPIPKKSLSLAKNNMHKFLQPKSEPEKKQDKEHSSVMNNDKAIANEFVKKEPIIVSSADISKSDKETNEIKTSKEVELSKYGRETDTEVLLKEIDVEPTNLNTDNILKTDSKMTSINTSSIAEVNLDQVIEKTGSKDDNDGDSIDSEDSEAPLIKCKLRSKARTSIFPKETTDKLSEEDTISMNSTDSELSRSKRNKKVPKKEIPMEDPEFIKYLKMKQDALMEDHPELTQDEIVSYLHKTWLYEENSKSELKKNDEIEQSSLVKGLNDVPYQPKKVRRPKIKTEKDFDEEEVIKDKPKRKSIKPFYNEEYSDIEEELEVFEIFKKKSSNSAKELTKAEIKNEVGHDQVPQIKEAVAQVEDISEWELYFAELTRPKPNIFKGLAREKVCEICENTHNTLIKCKGCNGMFHAECVKKELEKVEERAPIRGRKKKKKLCRKPKSSDEYDSQDDKYQDVSEENNISIEEILETDSRTVDADTFETQLEAKMKELLETAEIVDYGDITSEDELDWNDTVPGKCDIINIKLKPIKSVMQIDDSDFKCNNCRIYDVPVCFVCRNAVSKTNSNVRQKCHVAHCHKYYHLECLDYWPQTQFNGGEPSKNNKKISEHFEALTCPRHVCHTCVSDDPRGCKTRFSGDKLARCVRCPATYHSFTKCLPAGSQILSASHIICPRHVERRPGKVPCHVNTGWCFICALGGSLICCEYCPTSFHAECLNIKPPEGGYMCEDCETGRLPLYGEMVWVKLGHYRWWPGIILHPSEIPENILAVKHSMGEFVVRFFGQYDHYWVNRGRVFPFQEGDSGRISSQKSKIDAAFTMAMEHAQRACEILKSARTNEEESLDIALSLLPPHYVKLKVNKPCGSLCGRRLEDPESSLTQCECNPNDEDPCGPYSQCLNRMLLTECGPTCRAAERCNNRAFERRLYPKLVPYRTPSRGWGLKTLEHIRAGQFVIEYVGELIDEEEFRRRMRRKHEIRDENFYFLTLDKERMIDAGPKGNLARFMNHCCEPNCETQKWTVLGDVRVGLFALFDIPANSEVTFNYNLECAGIEKKRCMCGAKRCSGYIGAKPKQEESQSKKNKERPPKRAYKKRKPEESPSTETKPKRPLGRPPKPRELTEIEKDLLIIRNATSNVSSDESTRSISTELDRNPKALKRKRVSFSTEEAVSKDSSVSPSVKRSRTDEKSDVGD